MVHNERRMKMTYKITENDQGNSISLLSLISDGGMTRAGGDLHAVIEGAR